MSKQSLFQPDAKHSDLAQHAGKVRAALFRHSPVEQMAEFLTSLGNCERVDILPFHQMGRFKWERLGLEYSLADVEPPGTEAVERVSDIFRSAGLEAY